MVFGARLRFADGFSVPLFTIRSFPMSLIVQKFGGTSVGTPERILAVAHRDFIETGATGIRRWAKPKSILYDVKSVLPVDAVEGRL